MINKQDRCASDTPVFCIPLGGEAQRDALLVSVASSINFRERRRVKLNFEGVLKLVGLIGATCIALMAIGTLVVKISKGIVNLVRLVDDIHKGMQSQKDDSKILFKSQLACLDGLIQNGANGPVTKAKKNLEEYIFERFGGD